MGYFESLDSNLKLESTPIGVSFSTLDYSHESFIDSLNKGEFSDVKIRNIISTNKHLYFSYNSFTDPKTRENMQALWTNMNFLRVVLDMLKTDPAFRSSIAASYIRDVNVIGSDYRTIDGADRKEDVNDMLWKISAAVNMDYIVPLMSKFPESVSKLFTIFAFDTMDKRISKSSFIDNLRTFSKIQSISINVEDMIYLFYVFYKDDFSELFCEAMLHTPPAEMNEFEKGTEDSVSSALINILNSMSTNNIVQVLLQYSNTVSFMGNENCKARFSLHNLPEAFGTVAKCVSLLNGDCFIP